MTERRLLLPAAQHKAVMDGRKTQHRIVIRRAKYNGWWVYDKAGKRVGWCNGGGDMVPGLSETAYRSGDRLWLPEAWLVGSDPIAQSGERIVKYASDYTKDSYGPWRSPATMPKWAARIWLTVTDVRVQRLQDISRGDCMSEGCPFANMADGPDPRDWFRELWDSINGPAAWDRNPWVAAITFKRAKP